MQTVYLRGNISKFGEIWNVECSKIAEIFKLIDCQTPGFRKYLIGLEENNLTLSVVKGKEVIKDLNDIFLLPIKEEDIIITEVPNGSDDAIDFFIAAVTIFIAIQTGFIPPDATLFGIEGGVKLASLAGTMALNLALTGISMLLAPGPETDVPEQLEEESKAKLFNGPANVAQQNIPIPLLYGELMVGGATIYSSLNILDEGSTKKVYQDKLSEVLKFGVII